MSLDNIDIDQKELFKNAHRRIKQKKRLMFHLVIFVSATIVLAFVNLILNYAEDFTPFNLPWYISICLIWAFFLITHGINVLFVQKLMGRAWEEKYMNILVEKQLTKLKKLQKEVDQNYPLEKENTSDTETRTSNT